MNVEGLIRHGTAIEHFLHSTNLHNNNIIHTPTMAIHNCNNALHPQWTTIRSLLCEWGSLPNMAMPQLGNNTIVLACQLLYLHANAFITRNSIDKNASHFALCMIYILPELLNMQASYSWLHQLFQECYQTC